ncbi:hypothetical protein ACFQY0_21125 [Haloferula chungangensis]|uniref:Uncharacterized protein n=1 Tax=Haloferula chungangensis TaxID=1048331 RepID=A0ABW2LDV7_9BACT
MKHTKWLILAFLVVILLAYFLLRPSSEELNSESSNRASELIEMLEAHKIANGEYPRTLAELGGTTKDYSKYDPVPMLYSREGEEFSLSYQLLPMGPFRDYDSASSGWTFSE